ncbi:Membrane magnesium transporter [Arachis hypogaea]|nr:Membrane magnesium transporter [Arachis hypogaea]
MNKSGANPTSIQLAGSLKPLHSPPSFELVAELLSSGLVSAAFLSTSATACKICCGHRNENRLLQKLRLQVLEHPPGEWRLGYTVGQPPGLGIWRFRHTSHSPKPQNSSSRSICIVALQIMALGFAIGVFGVLILFHAAYSTIQYRGLLKITEEEFSGPPFNVVTELSLGLVLCMWAALTVPGKFLSIHPDSEENRIVSLPANLDFMIFNHRGKVFPVEMDLKLKQ